MRFTYDSLILIAIKIVYYLCLENVSFSPTAVKKEIQRMSDAFKDLGSAFQMDSSPGMLSNFYYIKFTLY